VPSTRLTERLARVLPTGFRAFVAARRDSHRAFVGPPGAFDVSGASVFNLLTLLGLREDHAVLDVGCGGLRAGRLLIVYLQPDRYFGIEPEAWLVDAAVRRELGSELVRAKRPTFHHGADFRLTVFGRRFDFILAASVFSHAALAQIARCLEEARAVLAPDGWFVASFVEGPDDYEGATWRYPETVRYRLATIERLAAAHGLACEPVGWPYRYGDDTQTWVAFWRRGKAG
jgi:SAM-dependent methyltransferase